MKRQRKYTYLLLDASQLAYRARFTTGEMSFRGLQTGIIFGVVKIIRKVIEDFQPAKIILAWDGGKVTRKIIYSDYKGQRDTKRSESTAAEKADFEDMMRQMNSLWSVCELLGLPQVKIRGVEADDIIGMLCNRLPETALVVSSDSDFLQLVSPTVSVWSPNKDGILYTLENFEELTTFKSPREYLFCKIISGDGGDNIPGIKGIGPKTAQKIVRSVPEEDLWSIVRLKKKEGIAERLVGHESMLVRNWMLIDLSSFIDYHLPDWRSILDEIHQPRSCDSRSVATQFTKLGFTSILSRYTGWISEFEKLADNPETLGKEFDGE